MLKILQKYFVDKDRDYSFEEFAKDITSGLDNAIVQFKDGDIDAEGQHKIF